MGDIQISGAAVTVISLMVGGLVSAVVYMYRMARLDQQQMRKDFEQRLADLRTDYQARLDECRQDNADLKAYLLRQAGTVKESTELLRELSSPRALGAP